MPRLSGNELVIATGNAGKAREFAHAFAPLGIQVKSLSDYAERGLPEVVEDGDTFAANARLKAKAIGDALGVPALADDSGLCVDSLGGEPGVYSARYAGEPKSDARNNEKLLAELGDNQDRAARFVCALALYDPATGTFTAEAEGRCEGVIVTEPRGTGGFGYDPLFLLPLYGRTMAELTLPEKQAVSHRGAAIRKLMDKLND